MKRIVMMAGCMLVCIQLPGVSAVSIKGTVKNSAGISLAGVTVSLIKNKNTATTDTQGVFSIIGTKTLQMQSFKRPQCQFTLVGNALVISSAVENMHGRVDVLTIDGRKSVSLQFNGIRAGKQRVVLPKFVSGLNLLQITMGKEIFTQTLVYLGTSNNYLKSKMMTNKTAGSFVLKQSAAVAVDTLIATKSGYTNAIVPIDSYEKTGIEIVMQEALVVEMPLVYDKENTGIDCNVATTFPAFSALKTVSNLPDPFLMDDGTRISTKAEWRCRRAEISSQIQHWISGSKGVPSSNLTTTYTGNKLTVTVTEGSNKITLSATITTPGGAGPFPVLIAMDGAGVPSSIFSSRGCATMSFTSSQLVPSSMNVTRGAGTYFSIYPDNNTGAMIEWAWGVSRIIDGLYQTADQNKIDVKHIAVTGCSYAGKMALYAGAFDERIALTIPEESGGGGEASWRVMATQTGTEDLEAAQGTAWYAANLKQFKNVNAPKLPVDMHELVAMVAPRAILTIGNTSIDRLGSEAGYVSMKAAAEVYKALGVPDRIGWSQNPTGTHCAFPNVQTADVAAFVDKFMLGKTSTAVTKSPYSTNMTKWITWTTPVLK